MGKTIKKQHLGLIEGFYGKPWGFDTRANMLPYLSALQYSFYLYAPKADPFLRERWREPVPGALLAKLKSFGQQCKNEGIAWGVGLSPFELHLDFGRKQQDDLLAKLEQLHELDCDWLAILFDDMRGDLEDLAEKHLAICHFVKAHSDVDKLLMCPSYYSFDPVLERVFGKMPENYLQDIGAHLHKDIDIFWTGEHVCSPAYSLAHLQQVSTLLKRKPFLWDNYPVNDGARMSPFLHLRAVEGREHCHEDNVQGVAVNPMNEAFLSLLAMASLSDCLRQGEAYDAGQSWFSHARDYLGEEAAQAMLLDLPCLQDEGLEQMSAERIQALKGRYLALRNAHNQRFMDELLAYLDGEYAFDLKQDEVPTQSLWQD